MKARLTIFLVLAIGPSWAFSAPSQGDVRDMKGELQLWYSARASWLSPEAFFDLELKRLNGPTYGRTSVYPPYSSVQEWETLIDVLADGSECPMVFFHSRWRRLPDVLALDTRARNHGGCKNVLK